MSKTLLQDPSHHGRVHDKGLILKIKKLPAILRYEVVEHQLGFCVLALDFTVQVVPSNTVLAELDELINED